MKKHEGVANRRPEVVKDVTRIPETAVGLITPGRLNDEIDHCGEARKDA